MQFKITEYVSIEKQMLLDAQKYIERADMYYKIGKTRHAVGCMVKAYKKLEKAEQFNFDIDTFMLPVIKLMLDSMANSIADKILKG